MRPISLLLLVSLTAAVELHGRNNGGQRAKRELLERSKRRWILSTIEVVEEDPGPYPKSISRMFNNKTAHPKIDHVYLIKGMGVTEEPKEIFSINEYTGVVFAHRPIDREEYNLFRIKFDILNRETGEEIDKELAFNVEIKDINDNAPTFAQPQMRAEVKENTQEGYLPVQLGVTDRDKPDTPNSTFTISMISQTPATPRIDVERRENGMAYLILKGCFDYDVRLADLLNQHDADTHKIKTYDIVLQAKDHGEPSLSSTAVVTLDIVDANSHPPVFKKRMYHGEVLEMVTKESLLRVAVEDKDTPKTPGWRAKYSIIKGDKDKSFKIETDPETNEGVLSVIKGRDYERTTSIILQVEVINEEPLFICKDDATLADTTPPADVANITIKVIDVNDPPTFERNKVDVYQREEEEPGEVLHFPKVDDVDSDAFRYILIEDSADWVTIDEKTGNLTTTKRMDRESLFVHDNTYKVVIGAVDNGEPPATGTCTVLVHLGDINDNLPKLANSGVIMCGNKANKVMVPANDSDEHPFSGPFTFSLESDDKSLRQRWKLDPASGMESGLISLKTLPFGNYSVPMVIQDQQGMVGRDTLEVTVCHCEEGDTCREKKPLSSSLGAAGIGLLLAGLLMFLLLLLLLVCECGRKEFKQMPIMQDEGSQTLNKYNEEGGGSACKAVPFLQLANENNAVLTDGQTLGMQRPEIARGMIKDVGQYNSSGLTLTNSHMASLGRQSQKDFFTSHGGNTMHSTWTANRTMTTQGGSSRYKRSLSLLSNEHISDHIDRRLYMINGNHVDHPEYQPHEYAYEGQCSKCQSLDELSLSNSGEDLHFLNDLGSKFKPLGGIIGLKIQDTSNKL